jgi:hypothetical protein
VPQNRLVSTRFKGQEDASSESTIPQEVLVSGAVLMESDSVRLGGRCRSIQSAPFSRADSVACHIQWLYLAANGCKTYLNLNLNLNRLRLQHGGNGAPMTQIGIGG